MAENIIFTGTGDVAADRLIQRRAAADQLRKIAQGVYTDNLKDPLETVTLRNVFKIAAHLCGPALLFGQSAFVA